MKYPFSSVLASTLFVSVFVLASQVAMALPPSAPGSQNAPIDGALWLLGLAGVAYGGHKAMRKSKSDS